MKGCRKANNMWYHAKDVALILGVGRTKSYEIVKELGEEQAKTKVPGSKDRFHKAPPGGMIQKEYFCSAYSLNVKECDQFLAERRKSDAGITTDNSAIAV